MAPATITLLDTRKRNDAAACGLDAATPYEMGGLKITAEFHPVLGPEVALMGMDGEVKLDTLEKIVEAHRLLGRVIRRNAAKAARAAEAA